MADADATECRSRWFCWLLRSFWPSWSVHRSLNHIIYLLYLYNFIYTCIYLHCYWGVHPGAPYISTVTYICTQYICISSLVHAHLTQVTPIYCNTGTPHSVYVCNRVQHAILQILHLPRINTGKNTPAGTGRVLAKAVKKNCTVRRKYERKGNNNIAALSNIHCMCVEVYTHVCTYIYVHAKPMNIITG